MALDYQLLYHKNLTLRSSESVKIILGETIQLQETHIKVDLESAPPKTLIFVAGQPEVNAQTFIRHVRADKGRSEFDFSVGKGEVTEFSELHISVPEDTQFNIGIYLKR